jgi:DNA-binding transcriptional regulator YiaG
MKMLQCNSVKLTTVERLTIIRKRNKWTQAKLAKELGVSISCVRSWEQGDRNPQKLAERALEEFIKRSDTV